MFTFLTSTGASQHSEVDLATGEKVDAQMGYIVLIAERKEKVAALGRGPFGGKLNCLGELGGPTEGRFHLRG